MFQTILYSVDGAIARITLNRPEVLNAINHQLAVELRDAIHQADENPHIRVLVLNGAGRAFSVGADLKERFASPKVDPEAELRFLRRVVPYVEIWNATKPVIAAVHGYCLAGACQMAGMCDLTIASDDALFGEPEVKFANPILMPITAYLLGFKKAKEFLYLGELWTAREAERLGLVNRVVARDDLEAQTTALAEKLAAIPPAALRLNKRAMNRVWELMGFQNAVSANEELLAYVSAYHASTSGGANEADAGFRRTASTKGLGEALGELGGTRRAGRRRRGSSGE